MPRKKVVRVLWTVIVVLGTLGMVFFTILPMFGQ
jgi:hypothetical protein